MQRREHTYLRSQKRYAKYKRNIPIKPPKKYKLENKHTCKAKKNSNKKRNIHAKPKKMPTRR